MVSKRKSDATGTGIASAASKKAKTDTAALTADTVDSDGDLTLVVGGTRKKFLVCSRALSRASPLFKAMLNGPFLEGQPAADSNEPWIVNLPEDKSQAMAMILNIIHGKFGRVPETIDRHLFRNILVCTEKYNMTEILAPWVKNWMLSNDILLEERSYFTAIGIAWEVGAAGVLKEVIRRLTMVSGINPDGSLSVLHIKDIETRSLPLIPPGLFQSVKAARSAVLDGIFRLLGEVQLGLQASLNGRILDTSPLPEHIYTGCRPPVDRWIRVDSQILRRLCNSATLGMLHTQLGNLLHYAIRPAHSEEPERVPEDLYPDSIDTAIKTIQRFTSDVYDLHGQIRGNRNLHDREHSCNPRSWLLKRIDELVMKQQVTISEENLARMREQRRKLGVDWDSLQD